MRFSLLGLICLAVAAIARPVGPGAESPPILKTADHIKEEESALLEISEDLERVQNWQGRMQQLTDSGKVSTLTEAHIAAVHEYESRLLRMEQMIHAEAAKTHVASDMDHLDDIYRILDEPFGEPGSVEDVAYREIIAEGPQELATSLEVLNEFRAAQLANQAVSERLQRELDDLLEGGVHRDSPAAGESANPIGYEGNNFRNEQGAGGIDVDANGVDVVDNFGEDAVGLDVGQDAGDFAAGAEGIGDVIGPYDRQAAKSIQEDLEKLLGIIG